MRRNRTILFLVAYLCCIAGSVQGQDRKGYAAAVAGWYEGKCFIELMQQEVDLKLELKRVHADSVGVKITDFMLPNGQKFSFPTKVVSVKMEVKEGKPVYNLFASFMYNYSGVPVRITVTGTIKDNMLDSEVKANLMDAVETKATYKAKKTGQ